VLRGPEITILARRYRLIFFAESSARHLDIISARVFRVRVRIAIHRVQSTENQPVTGAPLAEARDVFDIKNQFHSHLSCLDPLCGGMDHYVCPATLRKQLDDSVAGEAKHFEAKMLFVEGDRPFYIASVDNEPV
jgi:hypothetical protein